MSTGKARIAQDLPLFHRDERRQWAGQLREVARYQLVHQDTSVVVCRFYLPGPRHLGKIQDLSKGRAYLAVLQVRTPPATQDQVKGLLPEGCRPDPGRCILIRILHPVVPYPHSLIRTHGQASTDDLFRI